MTDLATQWRELADRLENIAPVFRFHNYDKILLSAAQTLRACAAERAPLPTGICNRHNWKGHADETCPTCAGMAVGKEISAKFAAGLDAERAPTDSVVAEIEARHEQYVTTPPETRWVVNAQCHDDRATLLRLLRQRDAVVEAAAGLVGIIEGVGVIPHDCWKDGDGKRLKDTLEWVQFYVAVKKALAQLQEGGGE